MLTKDYHSCYQRLFFENERMACFIAIRCIYHKVIIPRRQSKINCWILTIRQSIFNTHSRIIINWVIKIFIDSRYIYCSCCGIWIDHYIMFWSFSHWGDVKLLWIWSYKNRCSVSIKIYILKPDDIIIFFGYFK